MLYLLQQAMESKQEDDGMNENLIVAAILGLVGIGIIMVWQFLNNSQKMIDRIVETWESKQEEIK